MGKMLKFYKGNMVEYEILKLVDFYDDILREPTIPFDFSQPDAGKKAEYIMFSMCETLNKLQGLGMSANQVGLKDRVCVINMGTETWTMFNPQIIEKSETIAPYSEGCLSYPGIYMKVGRPDWIKVRFQAAGGQFVTHEFNGLTAVCIQHELDHLDGVMFTDLVSPIKFDMAKKKAKANLKKMKRVRIPDEAVEQ